MDTTTLAAYSGIACGVQAVVTGCAWARGKMASRRRYHGRHAECGRGGVRSRRGMSMVTGEGGPRWLVRLSVPRRGGMRAWGAASGDFERGLAAQENPALIAPRVGSEIRRDRDYVRVVVVAMVAAEDVAEAFDTAWWAFCRVAGDGFEGWDMAGALAEARPEGR
jgi:hypothetical protein